MSTYTTLISTAQLAEHLKDANIVIFDCRFDLANTEAGRQAYQQDHIPGARYIHLDEDLSSPISKNTGRHPLPDAGTLAKKLADQGVNNHTQVIAYDGGPGAMAARLWWLVRWLGHNKVAVLDGGFAAWQAAGLTTTAELPEIVTTTFDAHIRHDLFVNADTVEQIRQDSAFCLIDARAPERFSGEVEPLDKVAGHIPGAMNMRWEENLRNDKTFKSPDELQQRFNKQLNNVPAGNVIHSCGSGVTACHNLLAMEHAGLNGSRLYAGSWSEWIALPGRPVATINS